MNQRKRYGLLLIPESGLFYEKGKFTDGDGNPIPWEGVIRVHKWRQDAERIKRKCAAAGIRFIVLAFEPVEKDESIAKESTPAEPEAV